MFGLRPKVLGIILLLAVAGFVAAQYVPAYVTNFQYKDFVQQQMRFAGSAHRSPEEVRRVVVDQGRELGIDIDQKQVRLTRKGVLFSLEFEYEWPIDLKVYQHSLHFEISATGELYDSGRR